MNEQEAIKILSKDTSMETVNELTYYAGFNRDKVIEQIQEAMAMGANALEKQISLKRILEKLEERKGTCNGHKCEKDGCAGCVDCKIENAFTDAIEIVKEEGGIE